MTVGHENIKKYHFKEWEFLLGDDSFFDLPVLWIDIPLKFNSTSDLRCLITWKCDIFVFYL